MLGPLLLQNTCKYAEWGGDTVTKMFGIVSPYEKTGEIWTASAFENRETPIIISKPNEISVLSHLYEANKAIFGNNCKKYSRFPLLAKWIGANDNLSVQVHPDDEYALKNFNSFGKTEAWYIVQAKPGAQIIYGLKPGTTRQDLENAIIQKRIKDVLNFIPVKAGEIYYIPAGMVLALLDAIVVYEIQQSADLTFRLYDWDRNSGTRKLQINQALNVIQFEKNDEYIENNEETKNNGCLKGKYFEFNKQEINTSKEIITGFDTFKLCSVLEGTITIKKPYENNFYTIHAGSSFLLPSSVMPQTYTISGNATILISVVR